MSTLFRHVYDIAHIFWVGTFLFKRVTRGPFDIGKIPSPLHIIHLHLSILLSILPTMLPYVHLHSS